MVVRHSQNTEKGFPHEKLQKTQFRNISVSQIILFFFFFSLSQIFTTQINTGNQLVYQLAYFFPNNFLFLCFILKKVVIFSILTWDLCVGWKIYVLPFRISLISWSLGLLPTTETWACPVQFWEREKAQDTTLINPMCIFLAQPIKFLPSLE